MRAENVERELACVLRNVKDPCTSSGKVLMHAVYYIVLETGPIWKRHAKYRGLLMENTAEDEWGQLVRLFGRTFPRDLPMEERDIEGRLL